MSFVLMAFPFTSTQAQEWETFYEKNSWGESTSDQGLKSPTSDSTTVNDLRAILFVGCQRGVYVNVALELADWRDEEVLEVAVKFYPHDSRVSETRYEADGTREAGVIQLRKPLGLIRGMVGKGITSSPQKRIGIRIPWQGRRQAAFFWDIDQEKLQQHLRSGCPNYSW